MADKTTFNNPYESDDDDELRKKGKGHFYGDRYPHVHYHQIPDMQEFYRMCGILRDWCRALTFLGEQLATKYGEMFSDLVNEINSLVEKIQSYYDLIGQYLDTYYNALDAYMGVNELTSEQNNKIAEILYNLINSVGNVIVNILNCIETHLKQHDIYIGDIYNLLDGLREDLDEEVKRAEEAEKEIADDLADEEKERKKADEDLEQEITDMEELWRKADYHLWELIKELQESIEELFKLIQEIVSQNYEDISDQFTSSSLYTYHNSFTGTPNISAYRATVNAITYDDEGKATKHKYITDTIELTSSSTYPMTNSSTFTASNTPFVFAHSNHTSDSDIVTLNFGTVNSHYRNANCTSYEQYSNDIWNTTAYFDNDGTWTETDSSRSDWGVRVGRSWDGTNCTLYAASISDGYNNQYTTYIDKYFPTNNSSTITYVTNASTGATSSARILNLRHVERLTVNTMNLHYRWVFSWEE